MVGAAEVGKGCYEVNSREQQKQQQQTGIAAEINEREIWFQHAHPAETPPRPKQQTHNPLPPS